MSWPEHPFAATRALMRKPEKQGGGFAKLTEQQKWEWHADVYAFRRVVLGIRPERGAPETTPPDSDGKFFSAMLVEQAEAYYRERYTSAAERRRRVRGETDAREGRDLINRWAQAKGYPDVDAYAAAKEIHWSEGYREHIAETLKRKARPMKAAALLDAVITATEYNPSPEQMAAGRRDLGLDTEPV